MQLFFDNDCKVNPHFEYENPSLAAKYLQQFKEPSEDYMEIAKKILKSFSELYRNESHYLDSMGRILTEEETEERFLSYIEELEMQELITLTF